MKKIFFFILSFAAILFSCDSTSDTSNNSSEIYGFVSDSIIIKNGHCETSENNCYTINWKLFKLADTTDFSEYVNRLIYKSVAQNLEPSTGSLDEIDSLINSMQRDHSEFMKEFPESGISEWFDESETKILNNDPKLISLVVLNSNYYGGAHPNSFSIYLNFIPNRNKVLGIEDMFDDIEKVTAIVEKEFRIVRELSPDSDLGEEGFFLDNGKFFLPEGIGFDGNEVIFHYNPYEIGPYVFGNTEVRISKDKLNDFLKL